MNALNPLAKCAIENGLIWCWKHLISPNRNAPKQEARMAEIGPSFYHICRQEQTRFCGVTVLG